jgi:hypothetical protein
MEEELAKMKRKSEARRAHREAYHAKYRGNSSSVPGLTVPAHYSGRPAGEAVASPQPEPTPEQLVDRSRQLRTGLRHILEGTSSPSTDLRAAAMQPPHRSLADPLLGDVGIDVAQHDASPSKPGRSAAHKTKKRRNDGDVAGESSLKKTKGKVGRFEKAQKVSSTKPAKAVEGGKKKRK